MFIHLFEISGYIKCTLLFIFNYEFGLLQIFTKNFNNKFKYTFQFQEFLPQKDDLPQHDHQANYQAAIWTAIGPMYHGINN